MKIIKKDTSTFIEECLNKKGNRYDYSLVHYENSKKKIKIICRYHGVFEQTPNNHLSKNQDCPKCSEKYFEIKTTDEVVSNFKNKHGDKYDYTKVNYKGNKIKVEIVCKEHGSFYQTPNNHLKGQDCKKCKKMTTQDFINKSIKIHKKKYNYQFVEYLNTRMKVKIFCYSHGIFEQNPYSHLDGVGCPTCQESKGERIIRNYLDKNGIKYNSQYVFEECISKKKLKFDFFLPEKNTCIEYDGRQHFEPVKFYGGIDNFEEQIKRDLIKNEYCIDNNIKLIRISYKDDIENNLNKCLL